MGRQLFADAYLEFPPADVATVNTHTAATNLWDPALWSSIPAFETRAGKMWELRAGGLMGTTGTPTLIVQPRWGIAVAASNITFGASNTFTMPTLTATSWQMFCHIGCRSIGVTAATATLTANGQMNIKGVAAAVDVDLSFGGVTITTGPWNVATGVSFDATWSASSASNTFTTKWVMLRALN